MQRDATACRTSSAAHLSVLPVLLLCATLQAQNQTQNQPLPPSAPTHLQPAPAVPPRILQQAQPAPAPSHRAQVLFANDLLSVQADNSSLNQILREIGRVTGMKISGGVTEERVFGAYGPATAQDVLSQLLDGTGTNILLRQDAHHVVSELVLTPRLGRPTPPNPNAGTNAEDREDQDLPPQLSPRRPNFDPRSRDGGQFRPRDFGSNPSPAGEVVPGIPSPGNPVAAPPDPGTTTQQSPNGVRTPQQSHDDILRGQYPAPPARNPPN